MASVSVLNRPRSPRSRRRSGGMLCIADPLRVDRGRTGGGPGKPSRESGNRACSETVGALPARSFSPAAAREFLACRHGPATGRAACENAFRLKRDRSAAQTRTGAIRFATVMMTIRSTNAEVRGESFVSIENRRNSDANPPPARVRDGRPQGEDRAMPGFCSADSLVPPGRRSFPSHNRPFRHRLGHVQ
jgi:hypothetical protein